MGELFKKVRPFPIYREMMHINEKEDKTH